jgi:hypothetical protein
MSGKKLKLGVLLDSYDVPAWVYHFLERIADSNDAEFTLIILNGEKGGSGKSNLEINGHEIIYRMFNAVDEGIFLRKQNALDQKNSKKLFPGAAVIKVIPNQRGSADCFELSDINQIRGYELDILIKIGFENLRGDILTAARYGVWSYHFEGNPHGFWEVVEGQSETGAILHILGEESNSSKILYCSSSATYPFSPARNRNRSLWLSSSFLPRQITLLHQSGEKEFYAEIAKYKKADSLAKKQHENPPSNLLSLWLITGLLIKTAREILTRIFYLDAWFLMFDINAHTQIPFGNYKKILPPKGRFWADPYVIQKSDDYYVFIEEYTYETKKGHISVIEVDQQGNYKYPVRILEKEYHLSYPCVFEWEDKYYLIPESAENRTIDLYECLEFPNNWGYRMTLMENIKAVDTTIIFQQGKWWLFSGISENEGAFPEVELFLFFSDSLFTKEWKPHPKNPIVSDVKKARPAGRIFSRDGKLFRPSQDCSKTYGYGFDLNEVLVLSETEYKEEKVLSVRPDWDKKVLATHTYGAEGKFKVIDAYTRRRKFL